MKHKFSKNESVVTAIIRSVQARTSGHKKISRKHGRLFWFMASHKLMRMEDHQVCEWLQQDAWMQDVPVQMVTASFAQARKMHRMPEEKIQALWQGCGECFEPDGGHWHLRQLAASDRGPAECTDAAAPDEESDLPDWGGDSESEEHDTAAASEENAARGGDMPADRGRLAPSRPEARIL